MNQWFHPATGLACAYRKRSRNPHPAEAPCRSRSRKPFDLQYPVRPETVPGVWYRSLRKTSRPAAVPGRSQSSLLSEQHQKYQRSDRPAVHKAA